MKYYFFTLMLLFFSCKKEDPKEKYYFPIKAKIYLYNTTSDSRSITGAIIDLTDKAMIIGSSMRYSKFDRNYQFWINYGQAPPYQGTNFKLHSIDIVTDSTYLKFQNAINDKTDNFEIYANKDYFFIDLKSSNGVELIGPSKLNRLKPNWLWGYIQCKDVTFVKYAALFSDSLISNGLANVKKANPGPYYLFDISKDSLITHVREQDEKSLEGIIIPFLFEYNNDFNLVRSIAERFTYLPKDKEGVQIYIRDSKNNTRLIKYYL